MIERQLSWSLTRQYRAYHLLPFSDNSERDIAVIRTKARNIIF